MKYAPLSSLFRSKLTAKTPRAPRAAKEGGVFQPNHLGVFLASLASWRFILVFTFLACVDLSIHAQDPDPYPVVGGPVNPKVDANWNRYRDYAEATKLLQALAEAHPDRCKLESLGKSFGGREMWLMTITNPETGPDTAKPAFYVDGGIHANELQGPDVVLYMAWYLLEMDGQSDAVTRILKERTFYLLPMLSPDSRDAHMHEPNTTHGPRTGQRPVDDDHDALFDEDGADDLDGDGHITRMRIADPNGNMRPDDKFPEMLVRVTKDDENRPDLKRYRFLDEEGIDNDGDGQVNEDGDGFYDPNRDWPWLWAPGHIQGGAYRYPFSILENRMAGEFILAHPNIAGGQSFHNAGGMILRGPGAPGDELEPGDLRYFDEIGKHGERMLPGYDYLEIRSGLYPVWGGEVNWMYSSLGFAAFTNELFTPFNFYRESQGGEGFFGGQKVQHEFNRDLLMGDGFVPWHEVDHPTYGKVEVGGFKKSWLRQPPTFLLEEECHRNALFCIYHAEQMPRVKIVSVEVQQVEGVPGLRQVTAAVKNERLIPTRLAIDVKKNITPPDRATITGENAKVIAGMVADEPFFLQPREQKARPAQLTIPTINGRDVVYLRWLIEGHGPITVTLRSTHGGSDWLTVIGP